MSPLQKLQVRQSEIREKINTLLGNDKRSEEQDAELVKLTAQGQKLEPEIRAALIAQPEIPANETHVETADAETRELAQLTKRASLWATFSSATFEKRQTEGAPAELQKHYKLGAHQVPLEMLRINRWSRGTALRPRSRRASATPHKPR